MAGPGSGIRFDAWSVVHGSAELLLASEITLRRLDGDVPEKKLYLLQFSTGKMAEPGTRPAKIVRRKPLDACGVGILPDHVPNGFLRQSSALGFPVLVYRRNSLPPLMLAA